MTWLRAVRSGLPHGLRDVHTLIDDFYLNTLTRLLSLSGERGPAWLRNFYLDCFDGVIPDNVFLLEIKYLKLETVDSFDGDMATGADFYDNEIAYGIHDVLKLPDVTRLAILSHPLGGKTTFVKASASYPWLNGWRCRDVDDLYVYDSEMAALVEAHRWDEANAIQAVQIKANMTDHTILFCHSEHQAHAAGARVIGALQMDDSVIKKEGQHLKHPLRYSFTKLTKQGWRADRISCDIHQLHHRDEFASYVYRLTLPYQKNKKIKKIPPADIRQSTMAVKGLSGNTGVGGGYHYSPRVGKLKDHQTTAQISDLERATNESLQLYSLISSSGFSTDWVHQHLQAAREKGDAIMLQGILELFFIQVQRSIALKSRTSHKLLAKIIIATDSFDLVEHMIYKMRGCNLVVASSWLHWALSHLDYRKAFERMLDLNWFMHGIAKGIKLTKDLHDVMRRAHTVAPDLVETQLPTAGFLYMYCLMGRQQSLLQADDGSVQNRTEFPGVHKSSTDGVNYTYEEHQRTSIIAQELVLKHAVRQALESCNHLSFEQWFSDFMTVGSTGSAADGKEELQHMDTDARLNKTHWLNELDPSYIFNIPNTSPTLTMQTVMKLELGKWRALLPSPIIHWLAESIILHRTERKVFASNGYIALENGADVVFAKYMERVNTNRTLGENVIIDLDYADFNITHMITDMQAIFKLIKTEALSFPATTDYSWDGMNYYQFVAKLCDWCVECLQNLYLRAAGGDGYYHHLIRGLWSGWRTTQFINTTQNAVYAAQAQIALESIIGYNPIVGPVHAASGGLLNGDGCGDDMDATANNMVDALITVMHFQRCGHVMQPLKQMLGQRAREFLRVTFEDGKALGSLCRSVGSFWSSDMQTPDVMNGPEFAIGSASALSVLVRRGGSEQLDKIIRPIICEHFAQVRYYEASTGDQVYAGIDFGDMGISGASGGLGISHHGELPTVYTDKLSADYRNVVIDEGIRGARNNGVKALVSQASSHLQRHGFAFNTIDSLKRSVLAALAATGADSADINAISLKRKHAIAQYYRDCRTFRNKEPRAQFVLKDHYGALIDNVLDDIMNIETLAYKRVQSIDLEKLISTTLGVSLGPLNVSSGLIKSIRDAQSGARLTPMQVIQRVGEKVPAIGNLLHAIAGYPLQDVVNYMIYDEGHSFMDTGGLLVAELNPMLQTIQFEVLKRIILDSAWYDMSYDQWCDVMRAINGRFMIRYKEKYYNNFRA